MELQAVELTIKLLEEKQAVLSEMEKEFVLQFAFSTGDAELTNKLIDELVEEDKENQEVLQKYKTLTGFQPDFIYRVERLLIALELYRIQEEKAVKTLSELLYAYGISVSEDEIRRASTGKIKTMIQKEKHL